MNDDPDLKEQRTRLVRLLHLRHLGLDPAIKGFRVNEANTAGALEQVMGERLERLEAGGDWKGVRTGRIYDDCSPAPYQFFDDQFENWKKSVVDHATQKQGVTIVPVDLRHRGLTGPQIARVVDALNALPGAVRSKLVVLLDAE